MITMSQTIQGDALLITLAGPLDEEARLEVVPVEQNQRVVIDVHGLVGLNSLGLQTWLKWINSLRSQTEKIEFRGVRMNLAFQFNTVMGMFPKGATLQSIDYPMICDLCGREGETQLVFPEPISKVPKLENDLESLRKNVCPRPDCDYQPEMVETTYFKFLMRN